MAQRRAPLVERATLLLSANDVAQCLDLDEAIAAVESAFRAYHGKRAAMPPKSYVSLPEHNGDFRSMPARVEDTVAVKWVNSHPQNPARHGLPTVMGALILSDPATGYPLSVMDATLLTAYRTGAAAAVATRVLAREDAHTLGIVGCGTQASHQIAAISHVRDLRRVVLADLRPSAAEALARRVRERTPHLKVEVGSLADAARQDIVCTLTPVTTPIVERDWVQNGTHINALGADAAGKQELSSDLLGDALIVVDDWDQAMHSGEINVPLSQGLVRKEHVRGTLGAILEGAIPGRTSETEITIFDSTGLAIQDCAVARAVYERASKAGLGTRVDLVGRGSAPTDDVLRQMRVGEP